MWGSLGRLEITMAHCSSLWLTIEYSSSALFRLSADSGQLGSVLRRRAQREISVLIALSPSR